MITVEHMTMGDTIGRGDAKTPVLQGFEDTCGRMMTDEEIGPSRIRTCNQGIMSPALCH